MNNKISSWILILGVMTLISVQCIIADSDCEMCTPNASLFDGSTSNFTNLNISQLKNFSGLILENTSTGKIAWNNIVNVSSANFDSFVIIGANFVSIDSANLNPSLNSYVNITLYHVMFVNPIIKKNGIVCTSCSMINYANNTLSFSVTSLSNYTVSENYTGDGSTSSPFQITNCLQLQGITSNMSANYILLYNFSCTEFNFTQISNFTGSLDGDFHTINNYAGSKGVFALNYGNITKIILNNVNLWNSWHSGTVDFGALVDKNYGSISYCGVSGTVAGDSRNIDAELSEGIGGLTGINYGSISYSYSSASISGCSGLGSLVGHNEGNISYSYAIGSFSGNLACRGIGGLVGANTGQGHISDSYATGHTFYFNMPYHGGIVGLNWNDATVADSYYDTNTTGIAEGYTTEQMKESYTYSGWNFDTVWIMTPENYPLLRSFGYTDIINPTINLLTPSTSNGSTVSILIVNVTAYDLNYIRNITINIFNSSNSSSQLIYSVSNTTNNFYYEFTTLPDGVYFWNAIAYDADGNSNTTETRNIIIATVPVSSPPSTGSTTKTHASSGMGSSCIYDVNYNWECSAWSVCVDEEQTRECKRTNNCGSDYGRPITKNSCENKNNASTNLISEPANTPISNTVAINNTLADTTNADATNNTSDSRKKVLFDIIADIVTEPKTPGEDLVIKLSLINFGLAESVDANLKYEILDANGGIAKHFSKTVLVSTQSELLEHINTSGLSEGKYTIIIGMTYSGQTAPASTENTFYIGNVGILQGLFRNTSFSAITLSTIVMIVLIWLYLRDNKPGKIDNHNL